MLQEDFQDHVIDKLARLDERVISVGDSLKEIKSRLDGIDKRTTNNERKINHVYSVAGVIGGIGGGVAILIKYLGSRLGF